MAEPLINRFKKAQAHDPQGQGGEFGFVKARYIPKSLTISKSDQSTYIVQVKSVTLAGMALAIGLFIFAVITVPFVFYETAAQGYRMDFGYGFRWGLAYFVAIGLFLPYFLASRLGPSITIKKDCIIIGSKKYHLVDSDGFREGADDSWISQAFKIIKLDFLGMQYGIYSVRTPYLLPRVETEKVAPFLTDIVRSIGQDIGKDRERKIQQSNEF